MPGATFIRGEKIDLKTVEEEDVEFIRDTYNLPEVRKNLTNTAPANLEQEKDFFENVICSDEEINLAICVEGEMIGLITLKDKEKDVGEIGIWIHLDSHGKGYGTEACELLIEHAFNELRYHKITARAMESNTASQKVWKKLGFEKEGEQREQVYRDGSFENVIMYGVLENEWS